MSKVIKKGEVELGDISTETGFADTAAAPARRAPIISGSNFEARTEAQQIRDKALAEAEEIRRRAVADAERIRREAFEQGFTQGKDEGTARLSEVIASTVQRARAMEIQVEPQLRDLAVAIARKILGRELELSPDAILDLVKRALSEKARQRREVFLRVHPDDLRLMREHKAELLQVLSRATEIGIREDPDVELHGVVIETEAGLIDAQLETQLAVFERVLEQVR